MTQRGRPSVVTVVVPVLNGAATLAEQLSALAGQDFSGDWEVLVVDNGSTDGTVAVAEGFATDLNLRLTHEPRRGISHARNRGAREAHGDLLAFCDADDIVEPEWLEALVRVAQHHDMVGGKLEDRVINPPHVIVWRGSVTEHEIRRPGGWLAAVPGGNCAVWRDIALDLLWDPDFVGGSDDVDFCWRLQLQGYAVGWAQTAVVHYRYRTGARAVLRQMRTYGRTEALLYQRFATRGMPRRPLVIVLRAYLGLASRLLASGGRRDRLIPVLRDAAYCVGRVQGSLAYRVMFL